MCIMKLYQSLLKNINLKDLYRGIKYSKRSRSVSEIEDKCNEHSKI